MNETDVIEFYDTFAKDYDQTVFQQRDYTAFQIIPYWLLEVLKPNSLICDLGCGTGLGSRPFFEKHQVVGVDISPKMIEEAQKLPYKKLLCQSLENPLFFKNEEFDAVQMLGVMEFIHDPKTLFKEVFRILKTSGFFALTIPEKNAHEKDLGIFSFVGQEVEEIFNQKGFKVIIKKNFQGFIYKEKKVDYTGFLLKK